MDGISTAPGADPSNNESNSQELPAHVLAWGRSVRRPTRLPDHYDDRIDPDHIYVLDKCPGKESSDVIWVVAKGCDHCRKVKQACTRSGSCSRCEKTGRPCHTSDPGWDVLPGGRQRRPRNGTGLRACPSVQEIASLPASSKHDRRLRCQKTFKERKRDLKILAGDTLCSVPKVSSKVTKKGFRSQSKAIVAGSFTLRVKKPTMFLPSSTTTVQSDAPRLQRARKQAPFQIKPVAPPKSDALSWRFVRPPEKRKREENLDIPLLTTAATSKICPRVWASSRRELFNIFPEFSKAINDISWVCSETPVMIMEGNIWPDDSWNGQKTIRLSMVRDFICKEDDLEDAVDPSHPQSAECNLVSTEPPSTPITEFPQASTDLSNNQLLTPPSTYGGSLPNSRRIFDAAFPFPEGLTALLQALSQPLGSTGSSSDGLNRGSSQVNQLSTSLPCPSCACTRLRFVPQCLQCNGSGTIARQFPGFGESGALTAYPDDLVSDLLAIWTGAPVQSPLSSVDRWNRDSTIEQFKEIASFGEKNMNRSLISNSETRPPPASILDDPTLLSFSDHIKLNSALPDSHIVSLPTPPTSPAVQPSASDSFVENAASSDLPKTEPSDMIVDSKPEISSSTTTSLSQRSPKVLPPEITTLVEAHKAGVPILLILSRDCSLLPFDLPPECACAYLGYFFITEAHSERIESPTPIPSPSGRINGRVRWRFKFEWERGGEQFLPDRKDTSTPWWLLTRPHDTLEPKVQRARYQHWRDLDLRYYSFLPLDIIASQEAFVMEGSNDRGWHCSGCGKLNERLYFRHRECSNCKATPNGPDGYANELQAVRDPHAMIAMSMPSNRHPDSIVPSITTWEDGMRTFAYDISPQVRIQHLYTCNDPDLQSEPSDLFRDIQLYVKLRRQAVNTWTATGTYFAYFAGVEADGSSDAVPWTDVHQCVAQAQDLMTHRGRWYAEMEMLAINNLTILAWVATGSKKGSIIRARQSPVTLLCLGADVLLSITPKLGFSVEENHISEELVAKAGTLDIQSSIESTAVDSPQLSTANPGPVVAAPVKSEETPQSLPEISAKAKGKAAAKKSGETLQVTLMHGDILVLTGDDFEYSMSRKGTSILLVGSYVLPKPE